MRTFLCGHASFLRSRHLKPESGCVDVYVSLFVALPGGFLPPPAAREAAAPSPPGRSVTRAVGSGVSGVFDLHSPDEPHWASVHVWPFRFHKHIRHPGWPCAVAQLGPWDMGVTQPHNPGHRASRPQGCKKVPGGHFMGGLQRGPSSRAMTMTLRTQPPPSRAPPSPGIPGRRSFPALPASGSSHSPRGPHAGPRAQPARQVLLSAQGPHGRTGTRSSGWGRAAGRSEWGPPRHLPPRRPGA